MIDAIKRTLLAGVGAAVIAKDKAEAVLEDVKSGKITTSTARAAARRLAQQGRREFEQASDSVRELLNRSDEKILAKIEALDARLRSLEKKKSRARRK